MTAQEILAAELAHKAELKSVEQDIEAAREQRNVLRSDGYLLGHIHDDGNLTIYNGLLSPEQIQAFARKLAELYPEA